MEVTGAAILFFGSLYLLFFSGPVLNQIKNLFLHSYNFIGKDMSGNTFFSLAYTTGITLITS